MALAQDFMDWVYLGESTNTVVVGGAVVFDPRGDWPSADGSSDPLYERIAEASWYYENTIHDPYTMSGSQTVTAVLPDGNTVSGNAGGLRLIGGTMSLTDGSTVEGQFYVKYIGAHMFLVGSPGDELDSLVNQGIISIEFHELGTTVPDRIPLKHIDWPCFCQGTLILTDAGEVPVENLRVGDLVKTKDNGFQPIRWIGSRKLSNVVLTAKPALRPIRIRAGALGESIPSTDLLVSPQHRVLVRSEIAQRMFGAREVLAAAKQFCELDGINIAEDLEEVDYFHFLCDQHEVVYSNGAETESLYTGPMALKSVGPAALEEIFTIFPELRNRDPEEVPPAARELLTGRWARKLAARHVQNQKQLVSA